MNDGENFNVTGAEGFCEVRFPLAKSKLKPIFLSLTEEGNVQFVTMLDSGAMIPVWCSGARWLLKVFPEAILRTDIKAILGGFGTEIDVTDVYYVPEIRIYNGKQSLVFRQCYLPVVDRKSFGASLILPSSIFKQTNIIISQMEPFAEKQLIFQCKQPCFTLKYTVKALSKEAIKEIRDKYGVYGIKDNHKILGGENEFNCEMIPLDK